MNSFFYIKICLPPALCSHAANPAGGVDLPSLRSFFAEAWATSGIEDKPGLGPLPFPMVSNKNHLQTVNQFHDPV